MKTKDVINELLDLYVFPFMVNDIEYFSPIVGESVLSFDITLKNGKQYAVEARMNEWNQFYGVWLSPLNWNRLQVNRLELD